MSVEPLFKSINIENRVSGPFSMESNDFLAILIENAQQVACLYSKIHRPQHCRIHVPRHRVVGAYGNSHYEHGPAQVAWALHALLEQLHFGKLLSIEIRKSFSSRQVKICPTARFLWRHIVTSINVRWIDEIVPKVRNIFKEQFFVIKGNVTK